jgi:Tol biopolymer transport system component
LIYQNEDWGLGRFQIDKTGTKIIFSNNKNSKYDFKNSESGMDLWMLDVKNGETIQLTNNDSNDFDPIWLKDGKIIFVSNRLGSNNIWQFDLQDF